MTSTKLKKFWQRVDKVVFWIDFEKIKKQKYAMIALAVIFVMSIFLGPLVTVFVIGFLEAWG